MNPFDRLVSALTRLPGIGEKGATRLALHLLRDGRGLARELSEAIRLLKEKILFCRECENLTERPLCPICQDPARDRSVVCVVQEPVDVMTLEKTAMHKGLYHVLHGSISPLDGVGPDEIRVRRLLERVKGGKMREIIIATNTTPEGEATALYLKKVLGGAKVKVTRLATGIPVGGTVEYTDPQTLAKALATRQAY